MDTPSLTGKTVVITGASSGIGEAAARQLHQLGAEVVVMGRAADRTTAVAAAVGSKPIVADFARLADVRAAADELLERYERIDVLANNAGVSISTREVTEDGHELMFQTNHLAPFLLTSLLLDRLQESAPSRIITTASLANLAGYVRLSDLETERFFVGTAVYGTTKLENILFTRELGRRLEGTGVLATCFNPGPVATRFGRKDASGLLHRSPLRRLMHSAEDAAETLVWLASAPADPLRQGGYYTGRRAGVTGVQGHSDRLARQLWERSEALLSR